MKNLPEGYIAVTNTEKPASVFVFKGVSYRVIPGKNVFCSADEALQNIGVAPKTIIDGLQVLPEAPAVLFSAGEHAADKLMIRKSVAFFGQNAGIRPNLPPRRKFACPAENKERKVNESILKGSFWFGKIWVENACDFTVDGFSFDLLRIVSEVKNGEKECLTLKNIIFKSPCGDHMIKLNPIEKSSALKREIALDGIRFTDFDGLGYGKNFILGCANTFSFHDVCFTDTDKIFGFTDLARRLSVCPENAESYEIKIENSYFKNLFGDMGITVARKPEKLFFTAKNSVFLGGKVFDLSFSKDGCFKAEDCVFRGGGKEPLLQVTGECRNVNFIACRIDGFESEWKYAPALPSKAPACIDNTAHTTKCADPHRVIDIGTADFRPLEKFYRGRKVSYGDLHAHSNSGGKSDGKTPIEDYTAEMDKLSIDFTALVDHRQMRGYFLPAWDKNRFIYGMEPGTTFTWANGAKEGYNKVHYCMLFPHEYGLAMVFANFPEFGFRGDELTGFCKYPVFSKERFQELVAFIHSIGGLIVHPHPKDLMASTDPSDYNFGEHTFLETISVSAWDNMSFKNYELWEELLKRGCHVYASGGADAHGKITNNAVSVFYTKEKNGLAFFRQMKSGDFTVGFAGIKLSVDGHPAGSEIAYRKGQVLTLEAGDFFAPHYHKDHIYELRIFTDKGLAYSSIFSGRAKQRLALAVKNRKYYRADIFDLTGGYAAAISNPVWLDKKK